MKKGLCIFMVLGAVVIVLASCTSQPSKFYRLSPIAPDGSAANPASPTELALGVGPVQLPAYLDKPQIAAALGPHQLKYAEFDRWSQKLKDMLSQVLAENLSSLLGTQQVYLFPFDRTAALDYQVVLNVVRFDGGVREPCRLEARWRIRDRRGEDVVPLRKSVVTEQAVDESYSAMAAAMSRAVYRLSEEIAGAVSALNR